MKRILVFCVLTVAMIACNKDKVESTPHLKFKSFSDDVVGTNGNLRTILEFTDQEGDLDSVFMIRTRLNNRGPLSFPADRPYSGIPTYGNQNRGELQIDFDIAIDVISGFSALRIPGSNPVRYEPDTLQFKFFVKDKKGHTSDTAVSKPLYVIR